MEEYQFYALVSRMRYITRWGLMRNTFSENVQEHSHMVAVLAHALALIRRDILGMQADPERCAVAALFHDSYGRPADTGKVLQPRHQNGL